MKKFSAAAKSAAFNSFKELSEVVDGRTLPKTVGPLFFLRRDMNHHPNEYNAFLKAVNPNKPAYLFFDGASKSNPGPAGAGFVLSDELNNVYGGFSVNLLRATNNEAEYMAALFGVYCAHLANIQDLTVIGDSGLVIGQLTGRMQLKAENLQHYYYPLHHLCKQFNKVEFTHVDRKVNVVADQLANKGVKKFIELSLQEKANLAKITQEFRKTLLENPTATDPTKLSQTLAQDALLKEKLGEGADQEIEAANTKQ